MLRSSQMKVSILTNSLTDVEEAFNYLFIWTVLIIRHIAIKGHNITSFANQKLIRVFDTHHCVLSEGFN